MKTRLLALLAFFAATVFLPSAAVAAQATSSAAPEHQILVMVRHPLDHYRPNTSYGGTYGGEVAKSARERLARQIAKHYGLTLVEDWPMPMIGVDCFVMRVPDDRSTTAAAEQVSRDPEVAWAQPVELYATRAGSTHNDPLYAAEPAAALWHLADLHRLATGKGVRVAVIDSGIEARHPDLAGQLEVNENFVTGQSLVAEQHGTAVAGVIAAIADNGIGIAGVAPRARLLGLRACWQTNNASTPTTVCDSLSLARAIYFAADNRADVINLSLSGPDDRLLAELIKATLARGMAVVAAFDRNRPGGGFPATVPGVIAVSDTNLAGPRGDVYIAPGRDVPTTEPGGRWFIVNGSSFAAAHVSGLVALMRERRRSAAPVLVAQRSGGGAIDACATLARAQGACDCACGSTRMAAARR